ncbi:TetR/AcrR family transcriptional regulator [Methylophaga sulfidovorans]|uniref:Transcriptional regulator, TetR family n=1 Tax=Methylophaga sulfidovorans TaxID=45496 RepID=A0A1I4B5W3_9GAMM|nr:TetR/AcrR family transcriptional regulator [Methylophaga sulfidovorans]SFK64258.1 transcriptional regulator, TetR family [Methylophaga sulfidovorans]
MSGGRKKDFDSEVALQSAMHVFWEKGYIGASLSNLTERMGINKPSLYNTFGNKEALFIQATKLYCDNKINSLSALLADKTIPLKQRLKNYMMSVLSVQCESEPAKGCYVVQCQSEVASGEIPNEASQLLMHAGEAVKDLLISTLSDDQESKALGLDKEAKQKALCLSATLRGTATLARSGYSKDELEYVIDHSLKGIGLDENAKDSV